MVTVEYRLGVHGDPFEVWLEDYETVEAWWADMDVKTEKLGMRLVTMLNAAIYYHWADEDYETHLYVEKVTERR